MAITVDQQVLIRNRIAEALEAAMKKGQNILMPACRTMPIELA